MLEKRRLLINAIMSIVQVIITSAVLFILYRFLLRTIGVEQLGIWSLIIAITSVVQITDFGLSASIVKFVAKYTALKRNEQVSILLQTAIISLAIASCCFLVSAFPILSWLLQKLIPDKFLTLTVSILPSVLLSFWLMVLSRTILSGLDGIQRIHLRNIILMGATLINLILCILLVPIYGLIGVVFARIFQYSIVLIISWIIIRRYIPMLPIIPRKWDRKIFKEILPYSFSFQTISFMNLLFDPITKILLARFGEISTVGYYEMAQKMVLLFRSIIVSSNQVMVPAFAGLKENYPKKIELIYLKSYKLVFFLSVPLFSSIILSTPIISNLWIGNCEKDFVLYATILATGWFFNNLSVPAYFANMGTGDLRWNLFGQSAIGILNILLGTIMGMVFGGIGVVAAWSISLIFGSSIIHLVYLFKHKISLIQIIPKQYRYVAIICLSCLFPAIFVQIKVDNSFSILSINGSIIGLCLCIIGIHFWIHPMRREIFSWISTDVLRIV
jgi:O-antigen/teichoic acid export membrane protein